MKSVFSSDGPIFGREAESAAFKKVLDEAGDRGITVLTVGQVGMGKSTLLRRFEQIALSHEDLDCSVRRFRLGERDDPETFLDALVHETFGMTRASDGRSVLAGPKWKEQVTALFGVVNADKLFESLLGKEWQPTWSRLNALFARLSEKMDPSRRVAFFVDPEKRLHAESGAAWLTVVKDLPAKFLLVFAQRPDDALASHPDFYGPGIWRIPESQLMEMSPEAAEALIQAGLREIPSSGEAEAEPLRGYGGWPYAIQAGLLLLRRGEPAASLPRDPDRMAERLLNRISQGPDGEQALEVLRAVGILDFTPTLKILSQFLECRSSKVRPVLQRLVSGGLIREADGTYSSFHALFADQIRKQVREDGEWQVLHERAAQVLEQRLVEDPRDATALRSLPRHVREARGLNAYFRAVDRSFERQHRLGLLTDGARILEEAQPFASDPTIRSAFLGNLGVLCKTRGDLTKAEELHKQALAIDEDLDHKEGMASDYCNLGNLYTMIGDLDKAEVMHGKALAIHEKLGRKEGMAGDYCNLGNLHSTRGNLATAEEMYVKALALSAEPDSREKRAMVYSNLGLLCKTRGDLRKAEEMHAEALSINEKLDHRKGMASDYVNLGLLWKTRGDLAKAEALYRKALAIEVDLGHKMGLARVYGSLGVLYATRGDLAMAEETYNKALAIDEDLRHKKGMASDYVNLGLLWKTRGDLVKAEALYRKALSLDEDLGHKEGIASACGNLGNLFAIRGDLAKAEELYGKALALEVDLGRQEGMASSYGSLGILHKTRGDLTKAEEMHRKALAIEERLGHKEGIASAYGDLGNVLAMRGHLAEAEEMHRKALDIEEGLGHREGIASAYSNLGSLFAGRRDLMEADRFHRKALEINEELGNKGGMAISYRRLGELHATCGDRQTAAAFLQQALVYYEEMALVSDVGEVKRLLAVL